MDEVCWSRYPRIANSEHARTWLQAQVLYGRAANTIDAYGRDVEGYFRFCETLGVDPEHVTKEHIALYINDLRLQPSPRGKPGTLLANATLHRRLTSVRLYYDHLIDAGLYTINPVGRGRYTPGKLSIDSADRSLLQRYSTLPWIPTEEQWSQILEVARQESLRNRFMLALAYDGGLRREELCRLEIADLDPAHRQIRIRAEITKNHLERVVIYQEPTGKLYVQYAHYRHRLTSNSHALFLSESRRNRLQPVSIWTWTKVVRRIAQRAGVPEFTTHTLRHLCLTDLARAGWDILDIATFAGHRSTETTRLYIRLSARDLAKKLAESMQSIHSARAKMTAEVLL